MISRRTCDVLRVNSDRTVNCTNSNSFNLASTSLGTIIGVDRILTHAHWPLGSIQRHYGDPYAVPRVINIAGALGDINVLETDFFFNWVEFSNPGTMIVRFPFIFHNRYDIGNTVRLGTYEDLIQGSKTNSVSFVSRPPGCYQHSCLQLNTNSTILSFGQSPDFGAVPIMNVADPYDATQPGSSGGGVFVNGRLIGNHWASRREIRIVQGQEVVTSISDIKAVIPSLYPFLNWALMPPPC